MIKVHQDTAEAALFAMRYLLETDQRLNAILPAVQRVRGGTYDRYIVNAANSAEIHRPNATWQEAIRELADTLFIGGGAAPGTGNLIDAIATVLRQDFIRNRLTGDTLRRLRAIVLLPDEIAATRNLEIDPYSCVTCGVVFADGDVLTKRGDGFSCNRCLPAYQVVCRERGCTERVPIKNWEKVLSRRCANHANAAPPEAHLEQPAVTARPTTGWAAQTLSYTTNITEGMNHRRIQEAMARLGDRHLSPDLPSDPEP